ncbi:MAG: tol-pal system-associated acyl-CoA thioesterase [Gammaproteobacteria bacterium]
MTTTTESHFVRPESAPDEFHWPVRVYYEDTDAGGVVYHSNYLKFMERARTEWLRAIGFSQQYLREKEGIIFVVADMNIRFRKPAVFDEELTVTSTIKDMNAASLNFNQTITNSRAETICNANVTVACLEAATFRPCRIPDNIKETFHHVA